jgi:hypothetical protein
MSRVRDALKLADNWQGKSVFTGGARAPSQVPQVFSGPSFAAQSDPLKARPSMLSRWLRRLKRRIGLGRIGVAPRCAGTTRRGILCRAPAMVNGYCRMHGGSRRTEITVTVSSAQEHASVVMGTGFERLQRAVSGLARSVRSRLRHAA